jgi:NADH/NAD ratio-sensing transcriptional regulator Rex
MVKKVLIGGVFLGAGVLLYMKFFKRTEPTVVKWEDLDEEVVREKAKQIRIGVNETINANINKTKPTGDMLGLFPNGVNINWDKADFGNAFPNYG